MREKFETEMTELKTALRVEKETWLRETKEKLVGEGTELELRVALHEEEYAAVSACSVPRGLSLRLPQIKLPELSSALWREIHVDTPTNSHSSLPLGTLGPGPNSYPGYLNSRSGELELSTMSGIP